MLDIKDRLIKKAKQSSCRYRVSAVGYDKKGNILGFAVNKHRIDRYGGSLHAEVELIKQYDQKLKTIVICRINNNGNLLPIHPCQNCLSLAESLDITIKSISDLI